jgi:heme o synthase
MRALQPRVRLVCRCRNTRLFSTAAIVRARSLTFSSFFNPNERWSNSRPFNKIVAADGIPQRSFPISISNAVASYPSPIPLSAYRKTPALTASNLLKIYGELAKPRLTYLVVLTSMAGVALSPVSATVPTLLSTAIGTALCSASANALNQLQEVPFDTQMARTRMRPLVRRAIGPLHATCFALVTGAVGPVILWTMVNPTTAILGASNIVLYAGLYTWLKRKSVWNTWVGSVVGAIPPLMGWTACGGHLLPSTTTHSVGYFLPSFMSTVQDVAPLDVAAIDNPLAPFALFMLLFSWQFPHFNALAQLYQSSYAQAGYRMLSVFSPSKNTLVSLRHAALLVPICSVLVPLSGLTTWTFAVVSLVPNGVFLRAAWRFWRRGGEKEARTLFRHSLWYLPAVLGLMMVHKNNMDWLEWLNPTRKDREEA